MNEQERAALMGVESVLRGQPPAPAEHVATLVAHSPGKVSSMTCTCGVSVVGDVLPFAAVTRLMLEHLNGGKSDTVMRDLTEGHVQATMRRIGHGSHCQPPAHNHGSDRCAYDCPCQQASESPFDPANR